MKAYEISGDNGTYLELEDGRFTDTVSGDTSENIEAHEALEVLRAEITEHVTEPLCSINWNATQVAVYVGAIGYDDSITLREAADIYLLAYSTLAQYAREGRFEARQSGATWLTTRRAIEAAGIKPRQYHIRKEVISMANSYGFDGNIPADALYGVYDTENGEWTGDFFNSEEDAQKAADELADDERLGVVSVTEDDDWL